MKLSKVLRAIGRGAAIAAEFTPAGAAASIGLTAAGKALHQPDGVEWNQFPEAGEGRA